MHVLEVLQFSDIYFLHKLVLKTTPELDKLCFKLFLFIFLMLLCLDLVHGSKLILNYHKIPVIIPGPIFFGGKQNSLR